MVDMNHSVLGFSAKKHAIILAAFFFLFFILVIAADVVGGDAFGDSPTWFFCANFCWLAIFAHGHFFAGAIALLLLLKCNEKCLVIVCIIWPVAVAIVGISMIIPVHSREISWLAPNRAAFAYMLVTAFYAMILGSIHCALLLVALGFCSRGGAGADVDLYDLESSNSQEESPSSNHKKDSNIQ